MEIGEYGLMANIKTTYPSASVGVAGSPLNYSVLPWTYNAIAAFDVATSSSLHTSTQQADYQYAYAAPSQSTNVKIQAKFTNTTAYEQFGFTIQANKPPSLNWFMWQQNGGDGGVRAYDETNNELVVVTSANFTADTIWSITYDGAVYKWYQDSTLQAAQSSSETNNTLAFFGIYTTGASLLSIAYTDLTGSAGSAVPSSSISVTAGTGTSIKFG